MSFSQSILMPQMSVKEKKARSSFVLLPAAEGKSWPLRISGLHAGWITGTKPESVAVRELELGRFEHVPAEPMTRTRWYDKIARDGRPGYRPLFGVLPIQGQF